MTIDENSPTTASPSGLTPNPDLRVFVLGSSETLWIAARYLQLGNHGKIVAVMTRKSSLEAGRTESDFRRLAEEFGAPFFISENIDQREMEFAAQSGADVCVMLNWPEPPEDFVSLFPWGVVTVAFGEPGSKSGHNIDVWTVLQGQSELGISVKHLPAKGHARLSLTSAASSMSLDSGSTIADIRRYAEARLPYLFCNALDQLANSDSPAPAPSIDMSAAKIYHSLSRQDGRIEWRDTAANIDAKIRAFTRPASGAYTYMRDPYGKLSVIYVWRARIHVGQQASFGTPGQIIACNADNGDALVMTSDGIVALQSVSENIDGEWFNPGKKWIPERLRLGLSVEDELFALLSRDMAARQGG